MHLPSRLLMGLLVSIFACTPRNAPPATPSALPPTSSSPTQALASPAPIAATSLPVTSSPTQVLTTSLPTTQPTNVPTESPLAEPVERILLTSPLPGQGVRDVIHLEGISDPVFEQTLGILVRDAEGTVIASGSATIQSDVGQRGRFSADITLPSPLDTQAGRVIVYAASARDGGLLHLSSVEVELNSDKAAASTALDPSTPESIIITAPTLNAPYSGSVHVTGVSDPTFEQSLIVEVRGQDNNSLATVAVTIDANAGSRGLFSADVPFQVSQAQPGRVLVYSLSARDGTTMHLSSVEIMLEP